MHINDDGSMTPLHRFQDMGIGLGAPVDVSRPSQILSIFKYYKVNAFTDSFLKKKGSTLKLYWNDVANRKLTFSTTTWNDLKWMARKIVAIPSADILRALLDSGMPAPVADIYWHKLRLRRNEMVRFFKLEDEFEIYDVPDLKTYNPDGEDPDRPIVNGKVVQTHFPGKNDVVQVREGWLTFIPKLLAFQTPVRDWIDPKSGLRVGSTLKGLEGLRSDLAIAELARPEASTKLPIGIGASATLARRVVPNQLMLNANGKGHLYRIDDSLEITINADSPLLRKVLKRVPLIKAHGRLRFFRRLYEFTHYTDTIKDGYLSKFELLRAIRDPKAFAAFRLQPQELIKIFNSLGFEMEAGVGVLNYAPVFANEISAMGGIRKSIADYFIRDQFGQLHVYFDRTKRAYGAVNVNVGEVDAFLGKVSLLNLKYGKSTFKHRAADYVLPLKTDRAETQKL